MLYKILALVGGLAVCGLLTFAILYLHENLTLRGRDKEEESEE